MLSFILLGNHTCMHALTIKRQCTCIYNYNATKSLCTINHARDLSDTVIVIYRKYTFGYQPVSQCIEKKPYHHNNIIYDHDALSDCRILSQQHNEVGGQCR